MTLIQRLERHNRLHLLISVECSQSIGIHKSLPDRKHIDLSASALSYCFHCRNRVSVSQGVLYIRIGLHSTGVSRVIVMTMRIRVDMYKPALLCRHNNQGFLGGVSSRARNRIREKYPTSLMIIRCNCNGRTICRRKNTNYNSNDKESSQKYPQTQQF